MSSPHAAERPIILDREKYLQEILTNEVPSVVRNMRGACASGTLAAQDAEDERALNVRFEVTPAETCVAVLTRTARDGNLPQLYQKLMRQLIGKAEGYESLPNAIGVAAVANNPHVALDGDRAMEIRPALAFDAGFVSGYREPGARPPMIPDDQLARLSNGCLKQNGTLKNCYIAGVVHGARASGAR